MRTTRQGIASFLVRFVQEAWRDRTGEPRLRWRGTVRHVQTSEEVPFTGFAEVVAFMQRHLAALTRETAEGTSMDQDKLLQESLKLWEEFATTYSSLMFQAMDRVIQQSDALKQQLNEAVQRSLQAWKGVGGTSPDLARAVDRLAARVEQLAERVDRLERSAKRPGRKGGKRG
ncbi:MAG: hypothetical protein QN139_01835 [Armatimonadota bacterium]|nr:hypothetical protein [Armatimonadota bacterium]